MLLIPLESAGEAELSGMTFMAIRVMDRELCGVVFNLRILR